MPFDLLCGCSLKRLSVASHVLLPGQRHAEVSSRRDRNRLAGKLSSLSRILAQPAVCGCRSYLGCTVGVVTSYRMVAHGKLSEPVFCARQLQLCVPKTLSDLMM